jgi:hypothetical protein
MNSPAASSPAPVAELIRGMGKTVGATPRQLRNPRLAVSQADLVPCGKASAQGMGVAPSRPRFGGVARRMGRFGRR